MKPTPLTAALVLAVCAAWPASAQDTATQTPAANPLTLSLDQAVERALATSHRLAEAAAGGDAADAVVAQRHAAALPQLVGQAGYTRTNHVAEFGIPFSTQGPTVIYPDVPNNYFTRIDLRWPIYTAGRLDALERAARAEAAASEDDLAAARADLRLETTRAYWALVTAIQSVAVVEQSVARVGAHLRDVRNQLNAGLIPPNDVLNVEVQESRQRMLAIQARSARDIAEAELVRLVGASPGTAIRPSSSLDRSTSPTSPNVDVSRPPRSAKRGSSGPSGRA